MSSTAPFPAVPGGTRPFPALRGGTHPFPAVPGNPVRVPAPARPSFSPWDARRRHRIDPYSAEGQRLISAARASVARWQPVPPDTLLKVRDALRALPGENDGPVYAELYAETTGPQRVLAEPAPAAAAQAVPEPALPDPMPDALDDDGRRRDLLAEAFRSLAGTREKLNIVCLDCLKTVGRPCLRHASLIAEAAALHALADRIQRCEGSRDAILLYAAEGLKAVAGDDR